MKTASVFTAVAFLLTFAVSPVFAVGMAGDGTNSVGSVAGSAGNTVNGQTSNGAVTAATNAMTGGSQTGSTATDMAVAAAAGGTSAGGAAPGAAATGMGMKGGATMPGMGASASTISMENIKAQLQKQGYSQVSSITPSKTGNALQASAVTPSGSPVSLMINPASGAVMSAVAK